MLELKNNKIVIKQSNLNIINQKINEVNVDVIRNVNQTCANQILIANVMNFRGATVGGDVNIGTNGNPFEEKERTFLESLTKEEKDCYVELNQNGVFTFNCVNFKAFSKNMTDRIVNLIMDELIENTPSDEVILKLSEEFQDKFNEMDELNQTIKKKKVDVDVNGKNTTKNINKFEHIVQTKVKIKNLIKNKINVLINEDVLQTCQNSVNSKQGINFSNSTVDENINICNFTPSQTVKSYTECLNTFKSTADILNELITEMNIEIEGDVDVKYNSESKSENKNEKSEGFIQILQKNYIFIIFSCLIFLCLVILVFVFIYFSSKSK